MFGHRELNQPTIPELKQVTLVIPSSEVETNNHFGVATTVIVIGSGETGDVAYSDVNSPTKQVLICHKDGFQFAHKALKSLSS
jgi:dimethylaniline monooxygenase (N-oxide forming)